MTSQTCAVAGRCGGCPWIERGYAEQLAAKEAALRTLWDQAGLAPAALARLVLRSAGEQGLRDRTDVSWRRTPGTAGGVLGLWDLRGGDELVAVGPCPALSEPLREWLAVLQGDPPPLPRASLRLRVAPDGRRGLWIDAANTDIRALLDEQVWLRRQLGRAVVELGQKRKPLVDRPDGAGLHLSKEPLLLPWFNTWLDEQRTADLHGPVGGFTQPSLVANQLLVKSAMALVESVDARRWMEVGAGQGNFTLPLAARAGHVLAVEQDALARQGLALSAVEQGLDGRIRCIDADLQHPQKSWALWQEGLGQCEALLCDPPRSGLSGLVPGLASLPAGQRPRHLVYVSCHADTLVADLRGLVGAGYRITSVSGVDQFPQTPHAEWLVLLDS